MTPNLVISGMYMEMARGIINEEIQFEKQKNLNSIEEIPEIVQLNIKFSQFAGAVIFCVSSLEAYINVKIYDILYDRFHLEILKSLVNYDVILKNIKEFKSKYNDEEKRDELFKREKLTKKINILYRCLNLTLLSESREVEDKKLWKNLEKLQSIRNELIHPKPNFIESEEFREFFNQPENEFKTSLLTPILICEKLFKGTPVFHINSAENVILDKYIFKYKGNAIFEHIFLTSSEYTPENVNNWKTRRIF